MKIYGLFILLILSNSCQKYEFNYRATKKRNEIAGLWYIDSCHWARTSTIDSPNVRTKDFFDKNNRPFFLINQVLDDIDMNVKGATNIFDYYITFYVQTNEWLFTDGRVEHEIVILPDIDYSPSDSLEESFYFQKIAHRTYKIKEFKMHEKLTLCSESITFRGVIKNCIFLSNEN